MHDWKEKHNDFDDFPFFYARMEEIGASASKEYSLEKSMEKMQNEWTNLHFSFTPYRDTVSDSSQQKCH